MEPRIVLWRLQALAKRLGARASETLYEQASTLTIGWQRGAAGPAFQREDLRVCMVVYLAEGRHARCTIVADEPTALMAQARDSIQAALEQARSTPAAPFAGPSERYDITEVGLGLLDRRQKHLGLEDRRSILEDNVAGCLAQHPELRVPGIDYREQLITRGFTSSRGVAALERSTHYETQMEARFGRRGRLHVQRVAARQFANIASMPFGATLAKRIVALEQPTTLPQGPLPVILDAVPAAQLMRSLAPAFAAPAVRSGASFVAELLGQRLAAPRLHVIDDPTLPGALLSRAFDDRGVPPTPVVVLREGLASGLLFDTRQARVEGVRPTGHFVQGRVHPSNLVVRPGNRSRNAIGMSLGDYLVIDNLHADHPVDLQTGRLDTLCDLLVFHDHVFQGAVRNQPLRMPVTQLLQCISEVASDQARYCEVDACSIVLEGVDFPQ